MSYETMTHRYAKRRLANWLREGAEKRIFLPTQCDDWGWRAYFFTVWEEYPIALDSAGALVGAESVWDGPRGKSPSYEDCIRGELIPYVILDLAVSAIDSLEFGIEIIHTNPISCEKLKRLRRIAKEKNVHVVSADAQTILNFDTNPLGEQLLASPIFTIIT